MIRPSLRPPALALLPMLAACNVGWDAGSTTVTGSGQAAEETRTIGEFRSVSFALPGDLHLQRADQTTLRIEADDNLLDHIQTEVVDGALRVRSDRGVRLDPQAGLRVFVTGPSVESIQAAGSGDIEAVGFQVPELSVSAAGSGAVRLVELDTDLLRLQAAGSGSVRVSGRARQQVISLAGSGGVDAAEAESESVEANIAGSGSALVRVSDRLSANLLGSGSVRYHGDPEVTSRTVGSGRVARVD